MKAITRPLLRATRTPGVTLFSVLSIAMGIAATVGVYSVIRAVVRAPSYLHEDIANIYRAPFTYGNRSLFTNEDIESLRSMQRSFEQLTVWARVRADLAIAGVGQETLCEAVSGEYFQVLGVSAARGRVLQPGDDLADAPSVVVISHALWAARFNRDPNVIGQVVRLNGQIFDIVGVTPEWFRGVDMPTLLATQAWIPLHTRTPVLSARHMTTSPSASYLHVKGKLKPGITLDQAAAEIHTIGQAIEPRDQRARTRGESHAWQVIRAADIRVHETVHSLVGPLAASAFLVTVVVLIVVSSNLANIQLARGAARRHEFAVKQALGASRVRLAFEAVADVVPLALLGLGCGLIAVHVFLDSILPNAPGLGGLDIVAEPVVGTPLIVAIGAMLAAAAVGCLVPAVQVTRLAPQATLAQESATVSTPRWRARRLLIVAQVSVAVMLVDTAGFAITEMFAAAPRRGHYPPKPFVALRLFVDRRSPENRFTSQSLDLLTRYAQTSGGSTGPMVLASALPGVDDGPDFYLTSPDAAALTYGKVTAVAGPFFDLMGARFRRGRAFTPFDDAGDNYVIVLTETASRRLFGTIESLGRRASIRSAAMERVDEADERTVVGVIGDLAERGERGAEAFIPLDQATYTTVFLATPGTGREATRQLERFSTGALRDISVSPIGEGTLAARLNVHFTVISALTGLLGAMSFFVAIVGLFGLLSHLVVQRQREIGVRMALGASSRTIHALVVREGLQPVMAGLLVGTTIGLAVQLAIEPTRHRGIDAAGAAAVAVVALSLLAISIFAAYLPARRAASLDIAHTLRRS